MNLKNSEGYPDPTAGIALANVAKSEKETNRYRPLVYIASPFAGDTEYNISRARGYCRFAISRGCIPLAPHLHFPQFMDDSDRDEHSNFGWPLTEVQKVVPFAPAKGWRCWWEWRPQQGCDHG